MFYHLFVSLMLSPLFAVFCLVVFAFFTVRHKLPLLGMAALDAVISTVSSATLAVTTAVAGDSLVVRSFPPPAKAHLLTAWAKSGTVASCLVEIKSPRLHDAVHGIRFRTPLYTAAGFNPRAMFLHNPPQTLESQDTIEVDAAVPAGAAVVAVLMQNYYEDLPGVKGRFIDSRTLRTRAVPGHIAGVEVAIVVATGVGAWEGATAITSVFDTLKANKDYALIGATVDGGAGANGAFALSLKSSDTGNLRVAIPANPGDQAYTSRYFKWLDEQFTEYDEKGNPLFGLIPVFNASNKGSMIAELSALVAATYNAVFYFQELA